MPEWTIVDSQPLPDALKPSPFSAPRSSVSDMVTASADKFGVPQPLAHAVAQMESGYNPRARSGVGAMGVMQLMPATAQSLGVKNPWDAQQNIDGGMKYLAQLSDQFGGDPRLVMAAYNAGPGAVNKYGGVPPYRETQNYVAKGTRLMGSNAPAATTGSASRAADTSGSPPPAWREVSTDQPAPPPPPAQSGATTGGDDIMSRIMRGEQVQVTPSDILKIAFGPTGAEQLTPAPAPRTGDWKIVSSEPLPPTPPPPPQQPPALERAWNAFTGSSGLQTLGGLSSAFPALAGRISGMPDYANEQRFKNTVSGLYSGIVGEPARIVEENRKAADALVKGDFLEAADHIAFMIPFLGAAGAQLKDYLEKKDYAGAIGHAAGILGAAGVSTPEGRATIAAAPGAVADVAAKVPEVVSNIPGAVADAAPAVTQFVKTAAPDVAKGTAKMAAGTAMAKVPVPEVLKFGTGLPLVGAGAKQVIAGIKKGWAAAKEAGAAEAEAAPETAAPAAATAAPFQPGDVVQWQSQGVDQFQQPRRIRGFSPDGKYAFVEGTNTGIPVEQLTRAEPAAAPAAGPIITPPPADTSYVRAVPAQYPEVEPGFTRPAAPPQPATPELSFDELARSLTGKSPPKLTAAERASVQGIYDRITQGVPPEPAPSPRVMPQAQAAQVFPEAYPQPKPAPPAAEPVPAPAAPPVASQPPVVTPEPATPPASASSAAQALYDELRRSGTLEPEPAPAEKPAFEQRARDAKVDKLYNLIVGKQVPQSWVQRFTPESWRILAHEVGVPEPSAATIRQIKARLADYYQPKVVPINGSTTPAEAQAAFNNARGSVSRGETASVQAEPAVKMNTEMSSSSQPAEVLPLEHVQNEIYNLVDSLGSTYQHYALRKIGPQDPAQIGQILPKSNVYADMAKLNKKLPGSSAIALPYHYDATMEEVLKGLNRVKGYSGDRVVLIGSDEVPVYGEDPHEVVMPKAKVLGMWKVK